MCGRITKSGIEKEDELLGQFLFFKFCDKITASPGFLRTSLNSAWSGLGARPPVPAVLFGLRLSVPTLPS